MRYAFKFWLFRHSLLLLGVSVLGIIWGFKWFEPEGAWSAILPVGSILTFFYFLQKQQLKETRLMKELITDFNGRYGALNEELQSILKTGQEHPASMLTQNERKTLVDYFNLCAEEYLFYDLGYVEPRVWGAWGDGMNEYAKDWRIRELWKREKQSDSYYGFEFPFP